VFKKFEILRKNVFDSEKQSNIGNLPHQIKLQNLIKTKQDFLVYFPKGRCVH